MKTIKLNFLISFFSLFLTLSSTIVFAAGEFDQSLRATSSCPDFIVLNYAYGSEKENWAEETVIEFNKRQDIKVDGKCVRINTQADIKGSDPRKVYGAAGSGSIMKRAFDRPELKIHILSPASSLYLRLYEDLKKDEISGKLFSVDEPLVNSPIVIAMWEDMARALGWDPDIEKSELISWEKIVSLASTSGGWSSLGQSWGDFKFGHTSPHKSNSGLMSLVAEFMAAHKIVNGESTEDLTVENVQNPDVISFVENLEKSTVRYGESTGFFAKDLLTHGPDFIHAAVLYENLVMEYKDRIESKWGKKIVAIYPEEGTFNSDHPFAVVNSLTSSSERQAAQMFYDFLKEPAQQRAGIKFGFRPSNLDLVGADQLDENIFSSEIGIIRDLEAEEIPFFTPPKGDVINFLLNQAWQEVKKPSRTALVIDVSGSMGEGLRMQNAREGAASIVQGLTSRDSVKLIPFNDYVYIDNYVETIADNRGISQLTSWIRSLNPGGGTAYLDAVAKAYDYLCNPQALVQTQADAPAREQTWGEWLMGVEPEVEVAPIQPVPQDAGSPADNINSIILLTDGEDGNSSRQNSTGYAPTQSLLSKIEFDNGKTCNVFIYTVYYEQNSDSVIDSLRQLSGVTGLTEEGTEENIKKVLEKLSAFGG